MSNFIVPEGVLKNHPNEVGVQKIRDFYFYSNLPPEECVKGVYFYDGIIRITKDKIERVVDLKIIKKAASPFAYAYVPEDHFRANLFRQGVYLERVAYTEDQADELLFALAQVSDMQKHPEIIARYYIKKTRHAIFSITDFFEKFRRT